MHTFFLFQHFKCVQNGNKLNPLMRLFRKYVCHFIQCVKIPSNKVSYYDVFINRQMWYRQWRLWTDMYTRRYPRSLRVRTGICFGKGCTQLHHRWVIERKLSYHFLTLIILMLKWVLSLSLSLSCVQWVGFFLFSRTVRYVCACGRL